MSHGAFWYLATAAKSLSDSIFACLCRLFPRSSGQVVFGAWYGTMFADNPKYLLLYMLDHCDFRITWVGDEGVRDLLPKHKNLDFALKGTRKATWRLLRAKTWVYCQIRESDLTAAPIYAGARRINLWHGIPIKGMGRLAPARTGGTVKPLNPVYKFFLVLLRSHPDWTVVSNDRMADIMEDSFPEFFRRKMTIPCGLPRNDFLVNNRDNEELIAGLKAKYGKLLGFDPEKKVVLYLPTWRVKGTGIFAFYGLPKPEQAKFKAMLDAENAVVIEKHHPMTYRHMTPPKDSGVSIIVTPEMQKDVDAQELLLISDILVCDYSSAYIDYALLGRPCIHYADDLEDYKSDSGLVYRYEDVVAGRIVSEPSALFKEIEGQLRNPMVSRGEKFGELVEFERGVACETIARFIGGQVPHVATETNCSRHK